MSTKVGDKLRAQVTSPDTYATTTLPLVVNQVVALDGIEYVGFEGLTKPGFGPMWPRWYFYPRTNGAPMTDTSEVDTQPE